MKKTREFLNDILTRYSMTSFQELADALHMSRQAVHEKQSKGGLSPVAAVRVAKLLDLSPLLVIAATQAETAKTSEERELWAEIYREEKKRKGGAGD